MKPSALVACAACTFALAGCVVMPVGPMVAALPGSQKNAEQFHSDDESCRGFAQSSVSGAGQAAANNSAANTVAGTAFGAAAGALIGAAAGDAGAGAAIGAGTGLLFGSTAASGYGGHASYELQRAYDMNYLQCMYARGHRVPAGFVQQAPAQRYSAPTYPPRNYPPPNYPPSNYPPPNTMPPAASPSRSG